MLLNIEGRKPLLQFATFCGKKIKKVKNRVVWCKGLDIHVNGTWYGLHYYWQSNPLFDYIKHHRKCNSICEYGIIIFGLWLYVKIDS